tara:strand:+ start:295 stop:579 length:285 start_codon:yes stop_codon:yes gene_type:complete
MKFSRENLIKIIKEEHKTALKEAEMVDKEGKTALKQLKSIADNALKIEQTLEEDTQLPSWVQAKITLAADYLSAALDQIAFGELVQKHMKESDT